MCEKVLVAGVMVGDLSGFNLGGRGARSSRLSAHCVEVRS